MIQVYTGDGKGKTTAAFGLALRAAGAGMNVNIIQFGKKEPSSEGVLGEKLGLFKIRAFWAEGFLMPNSDKTPFREKTLEALEYAKNIITDQQIDLLILDEAIVCLLLGVLEREELEMLIDMLPKKTELIITGRGAPQWLIDRADLVTEMKKIKHYYDDGINARDGIEN